MVRALTKTRKRRENSLKCAPLLPMEDRLKIFANLIVDRLMEDLQNGTLTEPKRLEIC